MKVLHVCSSLARDIGGPARSVQGLVAALNELGCESWLMALKPLGGPWLKGTMNFFCANCPGAVGVEDAVLRAIVKIKPDIVHIHSIWMLNMHCTAKACRKKGVPYVFSTRGALNKWAIRQSAIKKWLALKTYQGIDFRFAAGFHATSEEEAQAIQRTVCAPSIVICPNGVNLPETIPPRQSNKLRRLLFLGRIHKVKGLKELLDAWSCVDNELRAKWVLEIVGNDEAGYWQYLKGLPCWERVMNSVIETGYLDDLHKWEAYARADCFILPSHSENFGIVVAEALYSGIPVIASRNTPWKDLEDNNCGWWVGLDRCSLVSSIESMMKLSDAERIEMGGRGRKLIQDKYSWSASAKTLAGFYQSIIEEKICEK